MSKGQIALGAVATVGVMGTVYVLWTRARARRLDNEAIAASVALRNEGNEWFKKGDMDASLTKYIAALDAVDGKDPSPSVADARELAQLNCVAVYLTQGRHMDAFRACTKILARKEAAEKVTSKALYRRAQALKELDRKDEAIADLEESNRISPATETAKFLTLMREKYTWGEKPAAT